MCCLFCSVEEQEILNQVVEKALSCRSRLAEIINSVQGYFDEDLSMIHTKLTTALKVVTCFVLFYIIFAIKYLRKKKTKEHNFSQMYWNQKEEQNFYFFSWFLLLIELSFFIFFCVPKATDVAGIYDDHWTSCELKLALARSSWKVCVKRLLEGLQKPAIAQIQQHFKEVCILVIAS